MSHHKIICGHILNVLEGMPDDSVDMLMTSVPYWGLRDYGEDTATDWNDWHGQLGLEPTPELYIKHLHTVFAEVKRVLKKSGTCWVNIGDSFAGSSKGIGSSPDPKWEGARNDNMKHKTEWDKIDLPAKCMCMIPERFAFMMLDLGYILRNKIIWHKCLSGNTPIYLRSKNKPLRTTVREAYRLPVKTLELATSEGWKNVIRIERQPTQDLLTIHLRNGMKIEVTPEHRFPINECLKEAKYLKKGDKLLHIQFPDEEGTSLGTREIGWIVGLYLAEGSKKKKGIQFSLHAKESSFSKKLQEFAKSFAGEWKEYIYGNNLSVVLSGSAVIGIIKNYIAGEGASKKHLTQRAFMENNKFLSGLLSGYLDGDGHYDEKNNRWRIGFTKNRELEWDLRVVCNRLGYHIRAFLRKAKIAEREYPIIRGEIRKATTGHFNQKDDYEVLRIENTKGITYEIEIEDTEHLFALADGTLTHNSNPMPSSVKDRFNTTYEMLYFFSQSRKYWFDLDAVRMPHKKIDRRSIDKDGKKILGRIEYGNVPYQSDVYLGQTPAGKNPGDLWNINTQPFSEAHFAVFPEKLCEKPILSGCPAEVCSVCGKARVRITETVIDPKEGRKKSYKGKVELDGSPTNRSVSELYKESLSKKRETIGWTDCQCSQEDKYEPGVVLDPFAGSGTVGVVAERLGRNSILIDIKRDYCEMAFKRLKPLIEQTKLSGERSEIERIGF